MSDMFSFLLLTTFSLPCSLYGKDSFKILIVCDLKAYLVTSLIEERIAQYFDVINCTGRAKTGESDKDFGGFCASK